MCRGPKLLLNRETAKLLNNYTAQKIQKYMNVIKCTKTTNKKFKGGINLFIKCDKVIFFLFACFVLFPIFTDVSIYLTTFIYIYYLLTIL